MRPCTYLLTYLHSWLWAYKTGNISETVEDRAIVAINGIYKVVHGLSILPPKCMILNDLWARFKVIDSLNAAKMTKYSLVMTPTPYGVAGDIISIRPTYSCTRALTYLLTQNNQCHWRLACDLVSWLFSEWFVFRSTAFQGRGDGPEAGTSGASEVARASCRLGSPGVLPPPRKIFKKFRNFKCWFSAK